MSTSTKRLGAVATAGLAALMLSTSALQAQGLTPQQRAAILQQQLATNMVANQFATQAALLGRYNTAVLANNFANPLMNPYAAGVGALPAGFPAAPASMAGPAIAAGSSMTSTPYGGGGAGFTSVPSTGAGGYPYNSGYSSPYYVEDPIAGYLR